MTQLNLQKYESEKNLLSVNEKTGLQRFKGLNQSLFASQWQSGN